jgi:hypothetical protein
VPAPLSSYADRLLRTEFRALDPGGAPAFGLPARPAELYRRRSTGAAEAEEIAQRAGEPADRYLRRAFAAGHPPAELERLATAWTAWGPDGLRRAIGRFDRPRPGPVPGPGEFEAGPLERGLRSATPAGGPGRGPDQAGRLVQCDGTTCGATVVVATRMIADPAYAHHVATAPPASFGAAQQRVQRAANLLWPRAFGVTPPGVVRTLNVHSGALGARYGWRPVDPERPHRVRAALRVAAASVDAGWPVPLLVGRWEPRHWVLVVGTDEPDTLLCYEPTNGRIAAVTVPDLAHGRADGLGYRNLQAIAYPTRLA